jgi:hypothetical protein
MNLNERMNELDARIAARREALDHKFGRAEEKSQAKATESSENGAANVPVAGSDSPASPATRGVSGKKNADLSGKWSKIMADMENGFDIPGLFTVPGIVAKILFVLFALFAVINLFWAVRYCFFYHPAAYGVAYPDGYVSHSSYWWMFWPVLVEAGFAYLIWWLCTKKK